MRYLGRVREGECLQYFSCDSSRAAREREKTLRCGRKTLADDSGVCRSRRFFFVSVSLCINNKGMNDGMIVRWSAYDLQSQMNSIFLAKNQGISITKNSASTTLHSDQPQGSSSFNVETTSINGFQTTKNELDIAMLQILDPHLRPVPPVDVPTSQKIYKEHMDLAQEYFKVSSARFFQLVNFLTKNNSTVKQNQTEIAYLTKHKESFLQGMAPDERNLRLDICNKLKEKVKAFGFSLNIFWD